MKLRKPLAISMATGRGCRRRKCNDRPSAVRVLHYPNSQVQKVVDMGIGHRRTHVHRITFCPSKHSRIRHTEFMQPTFFHVISECQCKTNHGTGASSRNPPCGSIFRVTPKINGLLIIISVVCSELRQTRMARAWQDMEGYLQLCLLM